MLEKRIFMNEVIIEEISKDLDISKKQVMTVLKLLEEGILFLL